MRTLSPREQERAWEAAGEDVSAKIDDLFDRCPDLSGFSVQAKVCAEGNTPGEEELFVTAIGICPRISKDQYGEIFEQISTMLTELLSERPEAHTLLRGRTFARALH